MARSLVKTTTWVVLVIVAGSVGYLAGRSRQLQATVQILQVEAGGNLVQRVNTLSLLRLGDTAGAIERLESEAYTLTTTIAVNRNPSPNALAFMKTYLSVSPPLPERENALASALAGVSVLEPGQCEGPLRTLLLLTDRTE